MGAKPRLALWLLCVAVYLCFAPGRILDPDDEIVFQTTQSLWERGDLAIAGIPKRTGEPKDRPDGTFGWAPGIDGKRYGFFGHALSVVALPLYGLGTTALERAPPSWRHVIRSDHYFMHPRSPAADWPRLTVSLTNGFVTAFAVLLLVEWLRTVGHRDRVAVLTGVVYAFGTSAWAYSGTFLSEPLSAVALLASAWGIACFHRHRDARPSIARASLWMAALVAGASVLVHVLNVLAIPILAGYALAPVVSRRRADAKPRPRLSGVTWTIALALGAVGPVALALSQASRFGSPWETGRYDHYGYFVDPLPGLVGQLVGPGRSLWLYSPALIVALWGWRRALTRRRAAAVMVIALAATRWAFVSARSDWWGGWGIGPRYLVPLIPLLLLPLAELLADLHTASRRRRLAMSLALLICVGIGLHLALHSIFEWMLRLTSTGTPEMGYLTRSHWIPSASPLWGFWTLPPDILGWQAFRLAQHGHPGPWSIVLGLIGTGLATAGYLAWWLAWGPGRSQPERSQPGSSRPGRSSPAPLPATGSTGEQPAEKIEDRPNPRRSL